MQDDAEDFKIDTIIEEIANYVVSYSTFNKETLLAAKLALFDSMGCAILALNFAECRQRLGPFFSSQENKIGCRIPGTSYILDPVQGTFNLGTQIRWLDFNDTWLGQEWGHPSDNFAGLLAVGDWLNQTNKKLDKPVSMREILEGAIKAYEIQGILALSNSYNKIGLDHVALVKIATAATVSHLLGSTKDQIISALTHAFCDLSPLRTYRHAPNTGPRKSWAAADAASRGVIFAELARRGEMAISSVITAPKWGLNDVLFKTHPINLSRPLQSYVMDHILFKIAFPAEFHAQTAVEAAFKLHPLLKDKLSAIASIHIETHESALKIIDKKGHLNNPADRDHCLQYMVAIALLKGDLKAEHYDQKTASDERIDQLREKMTVSENKQFSVDYLDPFKRSIASSLSVILEDGTKLEKITVEYPLGHKMRRDEALPEIRNKLEKNLKSLNFLLPQVPKILELFDDQKVLEELSVSEFISHFITEY